MSSMCVTYTLNYLVQSSKQTAASISTGIADRISMLISGDNPSDETLTDVLVAALAAIV